ncbi:HigA family addiction module antitoxin [uncultured Cocleimonas sp.]|uniref:HigA family addiction module antitoxin n=1 Tax=uncultured Cocleimonas sp. TaxID=1051587 RepID=UPI002606939D|nr:HigA family addiction module antitoxin [uncultured Cocleimonas sp.]
MSFQQHNPPHVGGLIYRTYIEPFDDISANKIADALGVARSTFSRLINGVSDLSPEMAVRLSAVLGGSAESWMRLQENYDLWKAREKVDTKNLNRIDFDAVA